MNPNALDIEEIARALRCMFQGLRVIIDHGDTETHLPFVTLQRQDRTPIAVVSRTIDWRWRCCNASTAQLLPVETVDEIVVACRAALGSADRAAAAHRRS